ncbi:replicative DNA helicase [Lutibacter aestuarii]|uniref:Replicative DNA helicase n=1 Tax=Lutibacter aestuarii TaxID=861111 RepID=A0ABW2ZCE1_9FLAO
MAKTKPKYNKKTIDANLLLPQDNEIELAIVGAMLLDKRAVDEVIMLIKTSEVFYNKTAKVIYEAILDLVRENIGVDLLTVSNRLIKNDTMSIVGGDLILTQIMGKISSTAHIEYHCRIVLEKWVRREIIDNSRTQINSSFAETVDIFDLLEEAEKGLDKVTEMLSTGSDQISFSAALQKVVNRVEMLSNQKDNELAGVTTGFKTLDKFTGGWQAGDLVIIAARPGMGKTSLILKNLSEIAFNNEAVGMFSLEMSIEQLTARLVAINSEFHLSQLIKKGFEHDRYFQTLHLVQNEMNNLPIYIDDTAGMDIHQMQMKARLWKRKYDIKALFVDYIQLMSGDGKNGNREQEISTISRKLKTTAKELKIPVIALSQLSRAVETRGGNKRPMLSDLRESGSLEQDADTVIFIYRPEYYGFELEEHLMQSGANTEINFAKYRAGSLATKGLYWQGDKTKFMDVEDKFDQVETKEHFI